MFLSIVSLLLFSFEATAQTPPLLPEVASEEALPDSISPSPADSLREDRSLFRFLKLYRGSEDRSAKPRGSAADSLGTARPRRGAAINESESTADDGPTGDDAQMGTGVPPGDSEPTGEGVVTGGTEPTGVGPPKTGLRPGPLYDFSPEMLRQSPDRTMREILPWISPLRVSNSGSPFTPDPLGWGDLPGRESVTVLEGGLPMQSAGTAESIPDALSPLWLSAARLRPASPIRLPNNPTGGALLELDLLEPDTTAISGARLSDGSFDSNSNEIYFVRPSGRNSYHLFWSDQKSVGRVNYGANEGSALVLRFGRTSSWGKWSLTRQSQFARQRVFDRLGSPNWRWLWDRSSYDLRVQSAVGAWTARLASSVAWHRSAWEGDRWAKRKDQIYRNLLWLHGPGSERWHPRITLQSDLQRTRFSERGGLSLDRWHHGLGFAAGLTGASRDWRYEVSAGRSDPGLGDAGWVWSLETEQTAEIGWRWRLDAGRSIRARLIPRLANDFFVSVGQTLRVPELDSSGTSEAVETVELTLQQGDAASHLRMSVRATQVGGTVSSEGVLAAWTADGFENQPLPESAFDQTVGGVFFGIEGRRPLFGGFALSGSGRVRRLDPNWEEQLWAVPAELRGRLSWSAHLFENAIWLDLFVRGHGETGLATTLDSLGSVARFDAGGRFFVGTLSGYFLLVNLEGGAQESATVSGGVMSLPLRSYRIGLTWRFVD